MKAKQIYGKLTCEEEQMVEGCIALAKSVAGSMYKHYLTSLHRIPMTYDDFYGVACLCLCMAAKQYKPEKGLAFTTYATFMMKKGIKKYVSRTSALVKMPSKYRDKCFFSEESETISFNQPAYINTHGDEVTIEETLSSQSCSMELFELMTSIDTILQDSREKHAFLRCTLNKKSQAEVGKELGVSQMEVSRMLKRAIEKLKRRLVA